MADDLESNDDRTEDATPERREEFREQGQIAVSRELTSVLVLAASFGCLIVYAPTLLSGLQHLMISHLELISTTRISETNIVQYGIHTIREPMILLAPVFMVAVCVGIAVTLLQTRFNFSWSRVAPDFSRMNPLKGVVRMVNLQAWVELGKGIAKMFAVGVVGYLVLKSEWIKVPGLLNTSIPHAWFYWGEITKNLFWGVSALMVAIAAFDFIYNFWTLENKMKMTKKELKEDVKRREVDPHVKHRMRRMQRDMASRRMVERTKKATVLVTNPTHYAVALQFELGMAAPKVVAKGVDFLALRMREVCEDMDITIVENKALARTLYKLVEVGDDIPTSLYKAVSEIIRFVFKLKGIAIPKKAA